MRVCTGDSKSPLGNIHPEYKAPVGQRLAWGARAMAYGEKLPYTNPRLLSATVGAARTSNGSYYLRSGSSGSSTVTLKFDVPVEVRSGHVGRFDASIKAYSFAWLSINGANATLKATPAGEVEATVPAAAGAATLLEGGSAPPMMVEYLQGDWPVPAIYAQGSGVPGLPAAPFITAAVQR